MLRKLLIPSFVAFTMFWLSADDCQAARHRQPIRTAIRHVVHNPGPVRRFVRSRPLLRLVGRVCSRHGCR